jgi:hypothetical protein
MGLCMAKFYLRFDTFKLFAQITPESTLESLLDVLAQAAEFRDIILRRAEKKILNAANHHAEMRFVHKGTIKTATQKISVLIQAVRCRYIRLLALLIRDLRRSGQSQSKSLA